MPFHRRINRIHPPSFSHFDAGLGPRSEARQCPISADSDTMKHVQHTMGHTSGLGHFVLVSVWALGFLSARLDSQDACTRACSLMWCMHSPSRDSDARGIRMDPVHTSPPGGSAISCVCVLLAVRCLRKAGTFGAWTKQAGDWRVCFLCN